MIKALVRYDGFIIGYSPEVAEADKNLTLIMGETWDEIYKLAQDVAEMKAGRNAERLQVAAEYQAERAQHEADLQAQHDETVAEMANESLKVMDLLAGLEESEEDILPAPPPPPRRRGRPPRAS